MALEVNVSVLKADYEVDRSAGAVWVSASSILPAVQVRSSDTRYQTTRERWEANQFIYSDRSYYATLELAEQVSVGGVMGTLESLEQKRASRENARYVRRDVAFEARQKYLEVLKAGKILEVRQEAQELSKRRLEKAEAMVEVGSAVRSDVLRAQVEVSSNELEFISAQNALRLAETDLRHFLRLEDDTELVLEDVMEAEDMEYSLESSLASAMEYRPDIISARHSLGAARYAVWTDRGGWFPYLTFSRTYTYQGIDFPDELAWFQDYSEWEWSIRLTWNLFDGLYTFGRVKSAKASRRIAEEDLFEVMRNAALEVRKATYNVDEARQRVEVSRETVSVAEEELRLSEERYRLGAGTMLEQIDSQVSLSEARTSYIEALYDLLLSQASLVRAMGKD
jgi:outer membrane protein TolC